MDERVKWEVTDDSSAEWALKKIKEATEERDRLLELIKEARRQLDEKENKIVNDYHTDTDYLKLLLRRYMETVKCKSTKTQDTYQLLTGKLVRKHASTEYKVNDNDLLTWLRQTNHPEYIKTTSAVRWADLKQMLEMDVETGIVTMPTGEIVEGVEIVEKPEGFDIKF